MTTRTVTVDYNGITLDVILQYHKAYRAPRDRSGWAEGPDEPASWDVYDVLHKGDSLFAVLSDFVVEEVEQAALDILAEEASYGPDED